MLLIMIHSTQVEEIEEVQKLDTQKQEEEVYGISFEKRIKEST